MGCFGWEMCGLSQYVLIRDSGCNLLTCDRDLLPVMCRGHYEYLASV